MDPDDGELRSSRAQLGSLAIAAPAYDEAGGIERCVLGWVAALAGRAGLGRYEIVVCNDGSQDETGAILDRLAAANSCVRALHHPRNQGAARALAAAIQATTAEWVLVLDADGQFPIACLDAFEAALGERPDARAIIGARAHKHDTAVARFGARVTTLALDALYGVRYRDLSSACQLVRGELLRSLPIEARGLNYSVEIAARLLEAGVRPLEVRISHAERATGRSTRTLVRSTLERAGFVGYLALRRALQRASVLATPGEPPSEPPRAAPGAAPDRSEVVSCASR